MTFSDYKVGRLEKCRVVPLLSCLGLLLCLSACSAGAARAQARFVVAERSEARCVIVRQPGATPAERAAAAELADTLRAMTGAAIPVREDLPADPTLRVILVGPGSAAAARFPDIDLARFGGEEAIRRIRGNTLLLAGGRPRGTVYAVSRFLQEQGGVRWWAPWATDIPKRPTFRLGRLDVREKPAFEYREPNWYPAIDAVWAVRNLTNGSRPEITPEQGGRITYAGPQFVHTFDRLVPEKPYLASHPEWFSLRGGKRVGDAQLCLTDPALAQFVIGRVREWLKASPDAPLVSISQNDNQRFCECPRCRALDEREGSHAGSLIAFVNTIAAALEPEFPGVGFDTLAYQHTRRPPKTLRPRPSVIVRLCSIECNFGVPFTDKANAAFAADMTDWSRICGRLYVWDYTTNFRNYIQPHPNWFTLGDNLRFFQRNNVRGVFSEGDFQSHGAEMAEMRSWVLAKLMWDPRQNDRALIDEFLRGYYGEKAAPPIRRYMDLIARKAKGFDLTCFTGSDATFLGLDTLTEADRLWQQAETASAGDGEKLWRIRQGRLPVQYAWLSRWQRLRFEAARTGAKWPLPESRKQVAAAWLATATTPGPRGWSPITHIHEGGLTPQAFVTRLGEDLPPVAVPLPRIGALPAPVPVPPGATGIDLQEEAATLFQEGDLSEIRADAAASDGAAVRMPGDHNKWVFQIPVSRFPAPARTGRWKLYAVVRTVPKTGVTSAPEGVAFTAGIWDLKGARERASVSVPAAALPTGYHAYLLGTVDLHTEQFLWVAPAANPAIDSVWVDRIYLVSEPTPA
jgi:hypothetical protein